MKVLRAETIHFKRAKASPMETGILINEGAGPIIDMDGKVVPFDAGIWNWWPLSEGLMTVKELEPPGEKR